MRRIGVLGAGTWGMALSRMLYNSGHQVTVWSAIGQEIDTFSATRRHPNLPGMVIPDGIAFTKDMETVCAEKDILLFAVPSVYVRQTSRSAKPYVRPGQVIVDVAKGIEPDTLLTMTGIIDQELPGMRLVALSGPTHAEEVARDLPTTIVSASQDAEAANLVQDVFFNTCMRVYTNDDVLGVELCGALKNIIALASGVALGLGFGDNTKAALITRAWQRSPGWDWLWAARSRPSPVLRASVISSSPPPPSTAATIAAAYSWDRVCLPRRR